MQRHIQNRLPAHKQFATYQESQAMEINNYNTRNYVVNIIKMTVNLKDLKRTEKSGKPSWKKCYICWALKVE